LHDADEQGRPRFPAADLEQALTLNMLISNGIIGRTASFDLFRNWRARIPVVWGARRERCSSLEPTAGSLNDRPARPTNLAVHPASSRWKTFSLSSITAIL
jgi:hypothetical protein